MYDSEVDVARLLHTYGVGDPLPNPELARARGALTAHYRPELGEPFVTAGCCYYRDGRDSVAWHGDTIGRGKTQDTMVAILSLGEARRLSLRPRTGGASLSFPVGHGDLLVMGGSCQRTWEHAVLKTARPVGGHVEVAHALGHGDLIVMGGSCQRTWEHAVPKVAHAGPRISVQFRPLNVF